MESYRTYRKYIYKWWMFQSVILGGLRLQLDIPTWGYPLQLMTVSQNPSLNSWSSEVWLCPDLFVRLLGDTSYTHCIHQRFETRDVFRYQECVEGFSLPIFCQMWSHHMLFIYIYIYTPQKFNIDTKNSTPSSWVSMLVFGSVYISTSTQLPLFEPESYPRCLNRFIQIQRMFFFSSVPAWRDFNKVHHENIGRVQSLKGCTVFQ